MAELSRVARRMTLDEIEEFAWRARWNLGVLPGSRVPVAMVIENHLTKMMPKVVIKVAFNGELGAAEAITHQSLPVITFSEKTYDGLYRDEPRPRMTAAHELGHLLLHTGRCAYAFAPKYDRRIDPEAQADAFAAAFLMPEGMFRAVTSIEEAMERFGVSRAAATGRARALKMWRLINSKPKFGRTKKKGHSMRRAP